MRIRIIGNSTKQCASLRSQPSLLPGAPGAAGAAGGTGFCFWDRANLHSGSHEIQQKLLQNSGKAQRIRDSLASEFARSVGATSTAARQINLK